MRVVQIINSLATGGAEKLLLETIPLYRKAGIEMDILLLWDNNHFFTKSLKDLNCCKVIILNQSTNYKDIYSIMNIFKIKKYLKEYDIAHVHLFPVQYFVIFANLLIFNKCKLVFTEHNTSNRRMGFFLFSIFDRLIYLGYKKIIAITDAVSLVLQEYLNSKKQKIVTIFNGVDLEAVEKSTPLNKNDFFFSINKDIKLLIQVGGFRIQKDQDTTIKSLKFLPNNFHLLLVGDGERKLILEKLVLELGLINRVHFLGIRNDVYKIIKASDCVIVSSHWEGFGLAAVEGMAANKPVIASNVNGLNDIVKGAGVLFECGNDKELAFQIKSILEDSQRLEEVTEACYKRSKKFSIEKMVIKHINLYESLFK